MSKYIECIENWLGYTLEEAEGDEVRICGDSDIQDLIHNLECILNENWSSYRSADIAYPISAVVCHEDSSALKGSISTVSAVNR